MDHTQHELPHERRTDLGVLRIVSAQHRAEALTGDGGAHTRLAVPAQSFRASSPST